VGLGIERVEVYAAVEIPDGGRGFAALACAKDWEVVAMLVVTFRDAHLGFYTVYCVLKHISLDRCNVLVDAKGSADNTRKVDDDAVVAGCSVVGEFQVA
jgi:hypothetical protein